MVRHSPSVQAIIASRRGSDSESVAVLGLACLKDLPDAASLTVLAVWSGTIHIEFSDAPKSELESIACVTILLRQAPSLHDARVDLLAAIFKIAYQTLKRKSASG